MAKQNKTKAADGAVELVAVGTVWFAGEEYLDGEALTVPAATADRLLVVGAAKLAGDEPVQVVPAAASPAAASPELAAEPAEGDAADAPKAPAAEA